MFCQASTSLISCKITRGGRDQAEQLVACSTDSQDQDLAISAPAFSCTLTTRPVACERPCPSGPFISMAGPISFLFTTDPYQVLPAPRDQTRPPPRRRGDVCKLLGDKITIRNANETRSESLGSGEESTLRSPVPRILRPT